MTAKQFLLVVNLLRLLVFLPFRALYWWHNFALNVFIKPLCCETIRTNFERFFLYLSPTLWLERCSSCNVFFVYIFFHLLKIERLIPHSCDLCSIFGYFFSDKKYAFDSFSIIKQNHLIYFIVVIFFLFFFWYFSWSKQ